MTVAPSDCLEFALGWRDHVFVSFDGGGSYTPLDLGCNPATKLCNGHLHTDYHAVIFDPNDPTTVFVGSDGGIASATSVINGWTPVVSSYFNEHLPNLEFGNGDASPGGGSGFGGEAGLLTGALQDNGVLYNDLLGGGRWLPVLQGDGITAAFAGVAPGASSQDDTRSGPTMPATRHWPGPSTTGPACSTTG